jgi:hypothetical protein
MSDLRRTGRPRTTHCKRNHERVPGEKFCKECQRFRYRMKYRLNEEFRTRKKKQVSQYRRTFRADNGFWPSELYRKPKNEPATSPTHAG